MNRFETHTNGQEVIDYKTGLTWRRFSEPGEYTFYSAKNHAQEVSQQTGLPWRVPTIEELRSLLDRSRCAPAPAFPATPSGWVWSSSPYVCNANTAWAIYWYDGYAGSYYCVSTFAVRLVRGD